MGDAVNAVVASGDKHGARRGYEQRAGGVGGPIAQELIAGSFGFWLNGRDRSGDFGRAAFDARCDDCVQVGLVAQLPRAEFQAVLFGELGKGIAGFGAGYAISGSSFASQIVQRLLRLAQDVF